MSTGVLHAEGGRAYAEFVGQHGDGGRRIHSAGEPAVRLVAPLPSANSPTPVSPQRDTPPAGPDNPSSAQDIVIDDEIRGLIPPPSADEEAALGRQLLAEGCRDALTVWAGRGILLDGHTRLGLCRRHGLPYATTEINLPGREAAIAWVLARQGGRRNLTPEGRGYVRGRRYLREKRARGGTGANQHGREQTAQNDQSAPGSLARLAAEYKVGAATIQRDARFAADVDALTANCGEEVRGWILTRDARLTRRDVARLALLGPEDQRRVIEQVRRDGRVSWPEAEDAQQRMTVPVETMALVQTLLRRLGTERAAEVCQDLAEALAEAGHAVAPGARAPG